MKNRIQRFWFKIQMRLLDIAKSYISSWTNENHKVWENTDQYPLPSINEDEYPESCDYGDDYKRKSGAEGELSLVATLTNHCITGRFILQQNLFIPYYDRTSEIDLVMVHEKGIFVFESKRFSGWIFGSINQNEWTQRFISGEKNHFYNPIKQNITHIKALSRFLSVPENQMKSVIVFSGTCELKQIPENSGHFIICKLSNLSEELQKVLNGMPVRYSYEDIHNTIDKLKPYKDLTGEKMTKHIESLQTRDSN